ncbi:MAG: CoA pyrophosphatase [Candidatus Eisenbacteria bacterium]|uniref:CoA pyrophosphatase n=1 Tax=Eiseniibacteriota bacterium TaxID=2212470 RepID=A0A937X8Y8_UNCEI|nr:CoA pyrophosphatase [Candidatus Eisenbacteria bacterium]
MSDRERQLALEDLVARLADALRRPLPGAAAQAWMAPQPRSGWNPRARAPGGRAAAVLVLVYPGAGDQGDPGDDRLPSPPTILLTERTGLVERHKRQVSFPGGAIERGESPEQAALREAAEETAVPVGLPRILGRLTPLWVPASGFTIHPIAAWADERPSLSRQRREVARIIEARVARLLDPRAAHAGEGIAAAQLPHPDAGRPSAARPWADRGGREEGGPWARAPYFDLDGAALWGASAMIMAEWLALIGWPGPPAAAR